MIVHPLNYMLLIIKINVLKYIVCVICEQTKDDVNFLRFVYERLFALT
jgi:hypothetical protein